MNLTLATNKQLWTIIEDDMNCPKELMELVVMEGFNRSLFDHLIKHLINKKFNRWHPERRYNYRDLYQLGYIGVINALRNYRPGKGSFKTFAYMNIKTEFQHHVEKINSEKRKVYYDITSLDQQKGEEYEETLKDSLIDEKENVEVQVMKKLYWEEQFGKLSKREKEVVLYFAKGYSLSEMAQIYNLKSTVSLHRQLHRSFSKINPNGKKINLKTSGLSTRTKETA